MLYREIIAVCSEIHIKHINTLCGQNVELLNVELAVHIVTTGPCMTDDTATHTHTHTHTHIPLLDVQYYFSL
jgi:hypothetical protein